MRFGITNASTDDLCQSALGIHGNLIYGLRFATNIPLREVESFQIAIMTSASGKSSYDSLNLSQGDMLSMLSLAPAPSLVEVQVYSTDLLSRLPHYIRSKC